MGTPTAPRTPHPWAFHLGPAHVIVHASATFREAFGTGVVGVPAREALLAWPPEAFALMDRVYREGRPLARRVRTPAGDRRLVVTARRDPETGETYGVTSHLRPLPLPRAPG